MKGDKTQLRTPQIRPYPLQEKFKILFLGGMFMMLQIVFAFEDIF